MHPVLRYLKTMAIIVGLILLLGLLGALTSS